MRPPKSHQAIIETLAFNAPQTIYKLNKETSYSTSTLHAAMKTLIANRLVKRHKKGFTLSFIGLAKYFANQFANPQFGSKEAQQILSKYASLDDYPLLSLHQSFEQWLGNEYYDHILSTSYIVNHEFETKIHIVYIKAPKPIKRGEKIPIQLATPTLEEEEKEWKHTFALTFFNIILTKPQNKITKPKDPNIQDFIKQTYNQEITKTTKDIQKLKAALRNLTKP